MKILLSLPLAFCLIGCPNAADTSTNSNPKAIELASRTYNAVDDRAAMEKAAAQETANKTNSNAVLADVTPVASAATPAAKKTYRVVDEAQPGMPPEMVAALKKAKIAPPPASMKVPDKTRLKLTTSQGDIVVELNGKAAPLHAKSFLYLSQKGFYNGTTFHRYEPGFVIQGGDPLSKDPKTRANAGVGGPGYQIPLETSSLTHNAMVLSMARTSDPDSAGSQFYITLAKAHFLDRDQAQDGFGYTVFGKVLNGQKVVLKLRAGDVLKSVSVIK